MRENSSGSQSRTRRYIRSSNVCDPKKLSSHYWRFMKECAGTMWDLDPWCIKPSDWPTMLEDAKDLVRKCPKCQIFASFTHEAATNLVPIINPIPFANEKLTWLEASLLRKRDNFLVVAIDYFTK